MKMVYQAKNGKVFEHPDQAQHEDRFIEEVEEALKPFRDKNIEAGQFVQRTEQQVNSLIAMTQRILDRYHGSTSETAKLWKKNPRGFVGRYLDDGDSPAYSIYGVLLSINEKHRQWQQPYYALAANRGEYQK